MVQHVIQGTDVNTTDTTTFVRITDNQREALRSLESGTSPPANPEVGQRWLDVTNAKLPILKRYTGSAWVTESVLDVDGGRIRQVLDNDHDTVSQPHGRGRRGGRDRRGQPVDGAGGRAACGWAARRQPTRWT